MLKTKITIAAGLAFGLAMAAANPALAGTDTQTMSITAVQAAVCRMSIPENVFMELGQEGDHVIMSLSAIQDLAVECNRDLPYTIEMDTADASGNFVMTDAATLKEIKGRASFGLNGPSNFQPFGTVANNAALTSVGTGSVQLFSTRITVNTDATYAAVGTYTAERQITISY
ncbi:TPA: hypothetical protein ACXJQL_002263 [Stenotrophomonas maltophilia]